MNLFKETVQNVNTTIECWEKVVDFLQSAEGPGGEKFNQEAEVPGTGQELRWFNERTIAVCNLVKSLEKIEVDAGAPIPLAYVAQLEQASQQLKDGILETAISAEQANDKGVASLDPGSWEVVVNETGANFNFASYLLNFKSHAETLLTKFYQVGLIVDTREFDAFTEAVREISKKSEIVRKNADEVSKAKKSVLSDASATNTQKARAEKGLSEISKVLETAKEILVNIEQTNQSSQSKFGEVSDISDKADSLKPQVDEYETQFQAFQKSLDDRNAEFEKWRADVKVLYGGLEEKDKQVDDVIQRAEKMLQGATNVGLATTFSTAVSELDEKLEQAKKHFHKSIFLLFVSALPLASYVLFLPLAAGFFDAQTVEADSATGGILNNLLSSFNGSSLSPSIAITLSLLAVPAIWLTKFSAARHHQLFQLKEDYQYKYSLAMAVDGFKKQSEEYADLIAAETFGRLLFNPADRLEGKGASDEHPSPLMNILMNKFGLNAKGQGPWSR